MKFVNEFFVYLREADLIINSLGHITTPRHYYDIYYKNAGMDYETWLSEFLNRKYSGYHVFENNEKSPVEGLAKFCYVLPLDQLYEKRVTIFTEIESSSYERELSKIDSNSEISVLIYDENGSRYFKKGENIPSELQLPEEKEVLIGQGKAATGELPLTFSNGIIKNIPITVSGIDTAKLGTSAVKAALEGFDETVTVNAKVCNYHINALGFKENGEYISAPKAGGVVSDAIFTNVGSYTQAKAVFAWYNSLGKLESGKIVDLSAIAPGETKKIAVGLQLPTNITGGMLKVFVMDSLSNITPIDVSALFTSFTATAQPVIRRLHASPKQV